MERSRLFCPYVREGHLRANRAVLTCVVRCNGSSNRNSIQSASCKKHTKYSRQQSAVAGGLCQRAVSSNAMAQSWKQSCGERLPLLPCPPSSHLSRCRDPRPPAFVCPPCFEPCRALPSLALRSRWGEADAYPIKHIAGNQAKRKGETIEGECRRGCSALEGPCACAGVGGKRAPAKKTRGRLLRTRSRWHLLPLSNDCQVEREWARRVFTRLAGVGGRGRKQGGASRTPTCLRSIAMARLVLCAHARCDDGHRRLWGCEVHKRVARSHNSGFRGRHGQSAALVQSPLIKKTCACNCEETCEPGA